MGKISFKWYAYWVGCLLGGLVLGFSAVYFTDSPNVPDVITTEEIPPLPTLSPSPSDRLVSIIFTGDVMLGRSVNQNILKYQDPTWPFHYVKDVLSEADITYVNLESPLVDNCPSTDSGMKFCGSLDNVKGLVSAGVDVASLANNHATNYGASGLEETVQILRSNGIAVIGVDQPAVITRKGTRYAFVSFNDAGRFPEISQADSSNMLYQISQAKEQSDLVIATFHWGAEYQSTPTNRQIRIAHEAIDNGADLVIGAHPHWIQTTEVYRGKNIYYSLGNFVFDQEWSPNTKTGLVVRANYQGNNLIGFDEMKVFIQQYGQPHWQ